MKPPPYFEGIRRTAARRWAQLEAEPELAAPWRQLFMQVQNPRHVVSELLQNADDAGAREAVVRIEDGVFHFEHDGDDFTEGNLRSLCLFGRSDKRCLHTIGFRGIGFKSTFSFGDRVEVHSPTLSICFNQSRFTEPEWVGRTCESDGRTRIRVPIKDEHRLKEAERNLHEWQASPWSLLFFTNLRRLRIEDKNVGWASKRPGPAPGSEWMAPSEGEGAEVLVVRSPAIPFPDDALEELRQERMLDRDEEPDLPPCKVELVIGAAGQIFVILPTNVSTALPFAFNAPFIQDPARLGIKHPETSPTNRWLLARVGQLAAEAMLRWLGQTEYENAARATAYDLFPDVDRQDFSLAGVCARIVEEAFEEGIRGRPYLLTDAGSLVPAGASIALPGPILDIWSARQAAAFLDEQRRPAFSRHVGSRNRTKLLNWGVLQETSRNAVLSRLRLAHPPEPRSWGRLLVLWDYVSPEFYSYWTSEEAAALRIVPARGKEVLFAAADVIRMPGNRLLESEEDWAFLSAHLAILAEGWLRFLATERKAADERHDAATTKTLAKAQRMLADLKLDSPTPVNSLIRKVAADVFAKPGARRENCVRLAQIAAKLGAAVGECFRYFGRDGELRSARDVLFDADGTLEPLLPEDRRASLLLHPDYTASFTSCSREEWLKWVDSGQAGLYSLPRLHETTTEYGYYYYATLEGIIAELQRRGVREKPQRHYVTNHFILQDWIFDKKCWEHWEMLAEDDRVWSRIAERILAQPSGYWKEAASARLLHVATTGTKRSMLDGPVPPLWACRLREKPCLRDTRGFLRKPEELLRRTPETEPLLDVESFLHHSLDLAATRPLLDLLGVRAAPSGLERFLDRLRALARSEEPPVREVEKLYRGLDQMVDTCSTEELQQIREVFSTERVIFSHTGTWEVASEVFLAADEQDVPGAPVVRPPFSHLALWRKVGVAERPTAELAIAWLKRLQVGAPLPSADQERVRALLARHPRRVWEECGRWLSLAGEWVAVARLSYSVTAQSPATPTLLDMWVRQKTADLRRVPIEVTEEEPFSALPALAGCIEDRFPRPPLLLGEHQELPWLVTIGSELCRIELESEPETNRVRALARRLASTRWQRARELSIVPYLDGTPIGPSRPADVLWQDHVLYVTDLASAKLAKRVPEEIAKAFGRAEIKAALDYSFERAPDDVRAYLEENFALAPADQCDQGDAPGTTADAASDREEPTRAAGSSTATTLSADPGEAGGAAGGLPTDAAGEPAGDADDQEPDASEWTVSARSPRRPSRARIIERFAAAQGFDRDGDGRFVHPDGSWIAKTSGDRFPWEHRTAAGSLVRYYWPIGHCLDLEPLEIPADVWGLIEGSAGLYSLILVDFDKNPVEMTGDRLKELLRQERLRLFPAAYRLVLEGDRDP